MWRVKLWLLLWLCGPEPFDGRARLQATQERPVTPTEALRPRAHMLAWQARRGARHNAAFCEPAGRAAVVPPSEAQRNDWRNFAECRVMLKRARSGRFTPEGLCLCVA